MLTEMSYIFKKEKNTQSHSDSQTQYKNKVVSKSTKYTKNILLWCLYLVINPSLSAQSSLSIFDQKYHHKCEDTYYIVQNKYLRIYEVSFGPKILRDDCNLSVEEMIQPDKIMGIRVWILICQYHIKKGTIFSNVLAPSLLMTKHVF